MAVRRSRLVAARAARLLSGSCCRMQSARPEMLQSCASVASGNCGTLESDLALRATGWCTESVPGVSRRGL